MPECERSDGRRKRAINYPPIVNVGLGISAESAPRNAREIFSWSLPQSLTTLTRHTEHLRAALLILSATALCGEGLPLSPECAGQLRRHTLPPPLRAGTPRNAPKAIYPLRAPARKPDLLRDSVPGARKLVEKAPCSFRCSLPPGLRPALAGHFSAQHCTCRPCRRGPGPRRD